MYFSECQKKMFLSIFLSVVITLWILFAAGLYVYHYVIEVILDLPIIGQQSPCTAHAALKQLIEKLLREVLTLPELQKSQNTVAISPELKNGTYEDLLATAILNKVIANSQSTRPSSSAASISSRLSNTSNAKEHKEFFFGEETLDHKWRNTDVETTSVSSLEDWLQSDSSFGSRKYVDRVTLTIKQDIEEISQISESDEDDEEDEDDDSEYFRTRSSVWSDDEPNWFLQKRQFQGTHSPVPVPMLVPNPTTEAKVLIGDKEIDETSDLSDVESEFGEAEIVPARHSLLVDSKTIIGGKNVIQNGVDEDERESESETSADSGVKEVDRDQSGYDESENHDGIDGGDGSERGRAATYFSRADITVDDDNIEDASILSVYSNTEKEAEYTEQYASLPRKIEKRPQPPLRPSLREKKPDCKKSEAKEDQNDGMIDSKDSDEEVRRVQMHFSGNYSRREKEKWKNAVEMKNNPYSKENIEKRITRSKSGVGSIFGPDYYAKLASAPSGTKSKSPRAQEVKELSWPPQKQETEERFDKYVSKTYLASEDRNETHTAVSVMIETDEDLESTVKQNYSTEARPGQQENGSPVYVAEVTSDSDLSYVNCYDVEKSQVYKKTTEHKFQKNEKTIKKVRKTPSLKRYKSESDLLSHDKDIPKVIAKKKDNTLISKIYKSLSKTDLTADQPAFRTQLSAPNGYAYNRKANSDDEYTKNRNKDSRYGSLSSNNSLEMSSNTMSITKKLSLSSEDDQSEHGSFYSEYKPIRNVFSSNEDFLSIDESDRGKKRDNTLITKIYQQPKVRNYALSRREHVPAEENHARVAKKAVCSDDEVFVEETTTVIRKDADQLLRRKMSKEDLDVNEIAKKKIVHNILDRISRFESKIDQRDHGKVINGDEITTSVKDLMKKFENNTGKNQLVSSLTARSLSRHTRKPLRE